MSKPESDTIRFRFFVCVTMTHSAPVEIEVPDSKTASALSENLLAALQAYNDGGVRSAKRYFKAEVDVMLPEGIRTRTIGAVDLSFMTGCFSRVEEEYV